MKIDFLPKLQMMPYLDIYGNCIEDDITDHVCQNCLNQVDEAAGIRGAALIHTSYYATLRDSIINFSLVKFTMLVSNHSTN